MTRDSEGYEGRPRPAERIFRRSRAAEHRRRMSEHKENRFMRLVFSLMSLGTLIIFAAIYLMNSAMKAHAAEQGSEGVVPVDATGDGVLIQPLIAGYSALDLMGLAFVIVAGYAVWRKFNKKD